MSLPGDKELEEEGCSVEKKSVDEMGRKEACSVWGTKVCRQPSFIIAAVCGTSVFMMKKMRKSFLHRNPSLLGKCVCISQTHNACVFIFQLGGSVLDLGH